LRREDKGEAVLDSESKLVTQESPVGSFNQNKQEHRQKAC